jgi:hypothetical protein
MAMEGASQFSSAPALADQKPVLTLDHIHNVQELKRGRCVAHQQLGLSTSEERSWLGMAFRAAQWLAC